MTSSDQSLLSTNTYFLLLSLNFTFQRAVKIKNSLLVIFVEGRYYTKNLYIGWDTTQQTIISDKEKSKIRKIQKTKEINIDYFLTNNVNDPAQQINFDVSSSDQNAGDAQCSPRSKRCDQNDIYYSMDGSCNNLKIPSWGQAGTAFVRLLPANYSDGTLIDFFFFKGFR